MILDIILFCVIAAFGLLYYRQDRIIKTQINYIDTMESRYLDLHGKTITAIEMMREIDNGGTFESEDEIGSVFKSLVEVTENLESEIENNG